MKSVIIAICALLLTIALPFVFEAIDNGITQHYTQAIAGVTTGGATYQADITLGRSLYNNDTTAVVGISSNISSDAPTAANWSAPLKRLTVSGLEQSSTRTLAVEMLIDRVNLPSGAADFLTLLRWFWVFACIGFAGGSIYAFFD